MVKYETSDWYLKCPKCGHEIPFEFEVRMTKTIWKYEVNVAGGQETLQLPVNAKVVHVACQTQSVVMFWAEVDPAENREDRTFVVHGTGHPVEHGHIHVGTAIVHEFVWHLYEVRS